MATTHTLPKTVSVEDFNKLAEQVLQLQAQMTQLLEETNKRQARNNNAQREMTDDDARNILNGELKDVKHNDAAAKLGLSYGQVYSARLGYTFKHIHKELKENVKGYKNQWIKE